MNQATSHSRLAKNTIALYVRGLLSVCIGLYTSRVIINVLGVDDYGVYGVAGGFVTMLAFINAAMAGATSRFITYEMGLGDMERIRRTFANALTVHIGIAVLIFVICEAVGVWFINTQLNIPPERLAAANWIFQLSILTAAVTITQVPYTALIISHERMGVYAYMEVLNVILKLVIVYFLVILPGDKLIIYGILTALVAIGIAMAYRIYCVRKFAEARSAPQYDKSILKPILKFSGLDLFGNLSVTVRSQGTTFLLNIFFGVAINGAASIATLLSGTIGNFSTNVVTAVRPQIIKNYAAKAWEQFQHLIELGSQASVMLLSMMAIPLILETPYVLGLWLGEVPEYVVIFARITLAASIFAQLMCVVNIGVHATARMFWFSVITGTLYIAGAGVMWIFFRLGYAPPSAFYIILANNIVILFITLLILRKLVAGFSVISYCLKLLKSFVLLIPAAALCSLVHYGMEVSFWRLVLCSVVSVVAVGAMGFAFILNKSQRRKVLARFGL